MKPSLKVVTQQTAPNLIADAMAFLKSATVYVGITEASSERQDALLDRAAKLKKTKAGRLTKKAQRLVALSEQDVNNAQLLFIHSNGSPLRGIPARPVIEPAIEAKDNAAAIEKEFHEAISCALNGDQAGARKRLRRAGMTAQNAARKWFTDSRNNWAPNKPATIRRKGSSKPLIDTAEMRKAITYVVKES